MRGQDQLSRRSFVKGLAAGGLVLGLGPVGGCEKIKRVFSDSDGPYAFVQIAVDGAVTIVAARSEMGQGIRTALPMVVADELEADWQRVNVVQAIGHPRYFNQNTDGSRSVRTFYTRMRQIGATARSMLESAAADVWNVKATECRAQNHAVVHAASGRTLGFGELAEKAAKLSVPEDPRLKSRDEFRYIGKPMTGVDVSDITQGRAVYGADVDLPGMTYASIERCPVVGGTVRSFDAQSALAMPGVRRVVEIPATPLPAAFHARPGIAVVADNTWLAMQARKELQITWDPGPNASFNSAEHTAGLRAGVEAAGSVVSERGDAPAVLAGADTIVSATYESPMLAHAAMEPLACVALVSKKKCEVWAPVQAPQVARREIAQLLEMDEERVTVNVTLLGGAFGRKAKPDFVLEAVILSREVGAPVQVVWSREDDIRHDYYHANCCQHYKASLDADGMPTAWLQRTAFPSIGSIFELGRMQPRPGELGQGFLRIPYRVPNLRSETAEAAGHIRIGWLRSVCNIFHAFGINSFVDELAAAAGQNPMDYHIRLLGEPQTIALSDGERKNPLKFDSGRLKVLIRFFKDKVDWQRPLADGHGLGFATHGSFLSYTAALIEASVGDDGRPRIHRVDTAIDCGTIVNPDTVRAQMEGATIFGLSLALYGRIDARNGTVEQSNFDDYPVMRLPETSEIVVHLLDSDAPPSGVGEPGVPPIAPAVCNAIFAATGKRVRTLPVGQVTARAVTETPAAESG